VGVTRRGNSKTTLMRTRDTNRKQNKVGGCVVHGFKIEP